ncbi:hypothetical protein [Domibacillus tundrae]|uniref:hypothetical protein n=1 Tax=Domibacillus tundrae TaxID=1587527 RepID=UPI000AC93C73|nr:hypothetical protein [Domibacillus tundrae]
MDNMGVLEVTVHKNEGDIPDQKFGRSFSEGFRDEYGPFFGGYGPYYGGYSVLGGLGSM